MSGQAPNTIERARRRSRRLALSRLYASEVGGGDSDTLVTDVEGFGPVGMLADELVAGVTQHTEELDALIAQHADNWTLDRMSSIDRAALRMAAFEITHRDDIPVSSTIAEAVELAKCFSTTDSGRFVNGVLGGVAAARGDDAS